MYLCGTLDINLRYSVGEASNCKDPDMTIHGAIRGLVHVIRLIPFFLQPSSSPALPRFPRLNPGGDDAVANSPLDQTEYTYSTS